MLDVVKIVLLKEIKNILPNINLPAGFSISVFAVVPEFKLKALIIVVLLKISF